MTEQIFPLPDVGEGLTEAEIVNWLVAPGDAVELNQVVCEIETAKSLVELPSPFAGEVIELLAQVGDTVPVGEPILRVRTEEIEEDPAASADAAKEPSDRPLGATGASDRLPEDEGGAVLVGYGTVAPARSRRRGSRSSAKSSIAEQRNGGVI